MPQNFQPERLRTLGDIMSESMGDYISESLGGFVGIGTLELDWRDVDLKGIRCTVQQKQGDWRQVDLSPRILAALRALPERKGRVFLTPAILDKERNVRVEPHEYRTGPGASGQIKRAWATACQKAGLPGEIKRWRDKNGINHTLFEPEDTPHSLRHTWATWHYCLHRDLLKLKEDGGWSTITMVAKYAKLMPEAYQPDIKAWMLGPQEKAVPNRAKAPKRA